MLTIQERRLVADTLSRVARCGTGLVARRRLEAGPGGVVREVRVVAPTACGLRWCATCEAGARRYRSERAIGPWGALVTLTLDPSKIGRRRSWRVLASWIGRLIRAMQREAARAPGDNLRVSDLALGETARWRQEMPDRKRDLPLIPYAWAIEPHESGFPHAHLALGLEFVSFSWVRWTWRRITGMRRVSPDVTIIDDPRASSRYLSKYITKAVFPMDLCIISRRRRLFWSSVPLPWKEPAGWLAVDRQEPESLQKIVIGDALAPVGMAWSDVVPPGDTYRQQDRLHVIDVDAQTSIEAMLYTMPADWDGLWWQWAQMMLTAHHKVTGEWNDRAMHDARKRLRGRMRREIARVFAVKLAWGLAFRWMLRTWNPVPRAPHLSWISAAAAVPACRFCRPAV